MHVDYGISFISLKNIFPPSAMCHQALKLPLDHVDSPCAMLAVFRRLGAAAGGHEFPWETAAEEPWVPWVAGNHGESHGDGEIYLMVNRCS